MGYEGGLRGKPEADGVVFPVRAAVAELAEQVERAMVGH